MNIKSWNEEALWWIGYVFQYWNNFVGIGIVLEQVGTSTGFATITTTVLDQQY